MPKRSGQTAVRHARAIVEQMGGVAQWSGKRVQRIPDRNRPGAWTMIALSEDVFNGCFDVVVINPPRATLMVQITTLTAARSSVAQRQRKIEKQFLAELEDPSMLNEDIQVWAWVNATGFRVWAWTQNAASTHGVRLPMPAWVEQPLLHSPLLKRRSA